MIDAPLLSSEPAVFCTGASGVGAILSCGAGPAVVDCTGETSCFVAATNRLRRLSPFGLCWLVCGTTMPRELRINAAHTISINTAMLRICVGGSQQKRAAGL